MSVALLDEDQIKALMLEAAEMGASIYAEKERTEENPPRFVMTTTQLAAYWQVTPVALRKWMHRANHPLPFHSVGADPRFHLSEVNQWSREEAERKHAKDLGVQG